MAPEFSRIFQIGSKADCITFDIEASAAERSALARRFDLVSLDRLVGQGTLDIAPRGNKAVLAARVMATVTQSCVVTMEPVRSEIDEDFTLVFERESPGFDEFRQPGPPREVFVDLDDEAAEPFDDRGIDVGEVIAEQMGLALDPYPRSPGADKVLEELNPEEDDNGGAASPFEILARQRRN